MSSEKFCLRWNDFEHNISSAFRELRDDKDFFDVTLACDDEQIQAHKVILSACSPFFRNVLRRNAHQHPLLYLKGVNYTDLQAVLNFMYHGEVNVAQEELNSFLSVAEDLRVKGLTQNQAGGHERKEKNTLNSSRMTQDIKPATPARSFSQPQKKPHPNPMTPHQAPTAPNRYTSQANDEDIQEIVPVKSEPREPPPPVISQPVVPMAMTTPQPMYSSHEDTHTLAPADDSLVYDDSYDDYGQYDDQGDMSAQHVNMDPSGVNDTGVSFQDPSELLQYVERDLSDTSRTKYVCVICKNFFHQGRNNVRNHVESKHFPNLFVYKCDLCDKTVPSKASLQMHKHKAHRHLLK